jgi:hypothetical protein
MMTTSSGLAVRNMDQFVTTAFWASPIGMLRLTARSHKAGRRCRAESSKQAFSSGQHWISGCYPPCRLGSQPRIRGCGRLNRISASIRGASAGVRQPRGRAAARIPQRILIRLNALADWNVLSPKPLGPHFRYISRSHLSSSSVSGGSVIRFKQKSLVRLGAVFLVLSMRSSRFDRMSSVCAFAYFSWNRNEPRSRF